MQVFMFLYCTDVVDDTITPGNGRWRWLTCVCSFMWTFSFLCQSNLLEITGLLTKTG